MSHKLTAWGIAMCTRNLADSLGSLYGDVRNGTNQNGSNGRGGRNVACIQRAQKSVLLSEKLEGFLVESRLRGDGVVLQVELRPGSLYAQRFRGVGLGAKGELARLLGVAGIARRRGRRVRRKREKEWNRRKRMKTSEE